MTRPTDPVNLRPLPRFIFSSRWLQLPLYLGLIVAQVVYVWYFWQEITHLVGETFFVDVTHRLGETEIMLLVLDLIDVVMISNLLIMVVVGGYETFVSRLDLELHPDQPEWLSHVNAAVLKVKLATAIIGISSIHLLKTFINAAQIGTRQIIAQGCLHLVFLLSALALAATERLLVAAHRGNGHARPDTPH
ncbi:MAG: TIGR00645 family protein [Gammaproteobacteria bacterium]